MSGVNSISDRVEELLVKAEGLSNGKRTRHFVDAAKQIAAIHPDLRIEEYGISLSSQRGYALLIPPVGGEKPDSRYLLLSAHLDAAPGLLSPFGIHRPGANDNGFAAAFNIAYAEELAKQRGDLGIIIGGFPHEEGQGIYKLIFSTALASITASIIGTFVDHSIAGTFLQNIVNPSTSFLLSYFATIQAYDLLGGPFKQGLAGSARPFKNTLQNKLGLDFRQIEYAINLDMVGTADEVVEAMVPYDSPTVNPSRWVNLKRMDLSMLSELECMMLLSFAKTDAASLNNLLIHHHLLLGTSDHAELARYLERVNGILHINKWNDLHTRNDVVSRVNYENAKWYMNMLEMFRQNINSPWKTEEDLRVLENHQLIPVASENDIGTVYDNRGDKYYLLRRHGSKSINPVNILYRLHEKGKDSYEAEFVTYGIQDKPLDLLKYHDANLAMHLQETGAEFKKYRFSNETSINILNREYQLVPNHYSVIPKVLSSAFAKTSTFLSDRSLAVISCLLIGLNYYVYSMLGPDAGPSQVIQSYSNELSEQMVQSQYSSLLYQVPSIFAVSIAAASCLMGIMRIAPAIKRKIRMMNVNEGNCLGDYKNTLTEETL